MGKIGEFPKKNAKTLAGWTKMFIFVAELCLPGLRQAVTTFYQATRPKV